jgi:hypothetical protein
VLIRPVPESLLPELDVAPLDRDRAVAARRTVRAELVVEAAARAGDGLLQRAVDVDLEALAHLMDRVDADLGADGRAAGDRGPAVHGVEPAATLDGE